ncbi:ATP-binding cassette domain-containing protein [Streptomyces sp. 891-h]|uniref:ATP-binding cassette domain-containing protein n=1 Tax=Streptomyces sp. 891-h TaxID=2720714 RepID=UPI001FAA791E|nr:ATP-binding cassette domain-containing protein [Streptomyces sp. 891-h]UNZ16992.1 ATP-binding cassette domain-containing protein [Streptomyces sp. 891-h]
MIQAIGLTSTVRRKRLPRVDDLTFEARPGQVTVLLGRAGSGKSEALRLMLQLVPGRGVALFRGRPVQRIPHPAREIGALLGDVPGHPARTARGHMRMLTAVAGVPVERADEVLDVVGLSGLADQRLGDFSLGMDRRLGMAAALLGDPHTLVLDEPTRGLSPREASWLHGLLRGFAEQGGVVLVTSRDARETARTADRVVSLDRGRLIADQAAADFSRTRLRPRVAVRTPHAERFAAVLSQEARSAERSSSGAFEVVREGGSKVAVYGSSCAAVGESAFRHGILVHRLAEEIGDTGDGSRPGPLNRADGRAARRGTPAGAGNSGAGTAAESTGEQAKGAGVGVSCVGEASQVVCGDTPTREGEVAVGQASVPAPGGSSTGGATQVRGGEAAGAEPKAGPGAGRGTAPEAGGEQGAEAGPGGAEAHPAVARHPAGEREPTDEGGPVPEGALVAAGQEQSRTAAGGSAGDPVRRSQRATGLSSGGSAPVAPDPAPAPSSKRDRGRPSGADEPSVGERESVPGAAPSARPGMRSGGTRSGAGALLPESPVVRRPGPVAPLRYELLRLFGVRTPWVLIVLALVSALGISLVVAGTDGGETADAAAGSAPGLRLLMGWPPGSPFFVPPAAVVAGLLGAMAFGQEFRYPALVPAHVPVPRRLGLLVAKLGVTAATAVALCLVTALCNAAALTLCYGADSLAYSFPDHTFDIASLTSLSSPEGPEAGITVPSLGAQFLAVLALCVGCAWAGLLAAGVFRSTVLGVAAVAAVPTLVAPLVRKAAVAGAGGESFEGLPERLRSLLLFPWPSAAEQSGAVAVGIVSQPVGRALALSVTVLFCAYALTSLRGRPRQR